MVAIVLQHEVRLIHSEVLVYNEVFYYSSSICLPLFTDTPLLRDPKGSGAGEETWPYQELIVFQGFEQVGGGVVPGRRLEPWQA